MFPKAEKNHLRRRPRSVHRRAIRDGTQVWASGAILSTTGTMADIDTCVEGFSGAVVQRTPRQKINRKQTQLRKMTQ